MAVKVKAVGAARAGTGAPKYVRPIGYRVRITEAESGPDARWMMRGTTLRRNHRDDPTLVLTPKVCGYDPRPGNSYAASASRVDWRELFPQAAAQRIAAECRKVYWKRGPNGERLPATVTVEVAYPAPHPCHLPRRAAS